MKLNHYLNKSIEHRHNVEAQYHLDSKLTDIFRNTEFYCAWSGISKDCSEDNPKCFNHIVKCPKNKNGQPNPLFDYQQKLFDTIMKHKMVYCLKASGLGITETMVRLLSWLCLRDDKLRGTDIIIITGPRLELSISIIERIKKLFLDLTVFDTKSTTVILNGVTIKAYPSNHLDDARGIPNVSMIYCDESAFFQPQEQANLRDVIERYIIKSNPWIILTSTPNKPGDIMNQIMLEENSLYEKLYFDYTVGLGKMWTLDEIKLQMQSPSFEREYHLKFLGQLGNLFPAHEIDACAAEYDLTYNNGCVHWLGVDPGYGSSKFAAVIVRWRDGKIEVVHCENIARILYSKSVTLINQLITRYKVCKCYVDQSSASLVHELRQTRGEYVAYERLKPEVLKRQMLSGCGEPLICPVNFQQNHRGMMQNLVRIVSREYLKIHPQFQDLIISLKSATARDDNYSLDKSNSAENDLLDALRLSICFLKYSGE